MTVHNRFPWTTEEEDALILRKSEGARHKVIARELQRTPRAIDQQVARLREVGKLEQFRKDELKLLKKVLREAAQEPRYYER
jgi:hypothetical protein